MKLNTFIFNHFAPIPYKQWKQKIQYELQGADYQTELINTTFTGITHLPFYTQSENKDLLDVTEEHNSLKAIHITVFDAIEANKKALSFIKKGIDIIYFLIYDKEISTVTLFNNILIPVVINCQFLNVNFTKTVSENYKGSSLKILTSPLSKLIKTGNWYRDTAWDTEQLQQIIDFNSEALFINMATFYNAGASQIQQLSYAICQVLDYSKHITINKCKSINYQVSVSTDLYVEVAKIKALRVLHECINKWLSTSLKCTIILVKSERNQHVINTHLNETISQTEQLIGAAGGVTIIASPSINTCFFKEDIPDFEHELNNFLAIDFHQKTILFNNTIYIEKLTQQLVLKSSELINSIEQGGGFLVQYKKGIIHKKIEEKAIIEQKEFNKNWDGLIKENSISNKTPSSYPFFKYSNKNTQYKPIVAKRLTAPLEKPIWDGIYKND